MIAPGATVAQVRRQMAERFRGAGFDSPELDARILLGHALALDHAALTAAGDRILNTEQASTVEAVASRRLQGEPVARIVGVKEFWSLSLELGDDTLVPRPDTETLVEAALDAFTGSAPSQRPIRIADLGTGTGAILLALLREWPQAIGVGTDISLAALHTARRNAERHGLASRAHFVVCDFGAALAPGFDLIVSNPPYIASGDIDALPAEVRADPRRALDGGPDGLDAYRRIAAQAPTLLRKDGALILELGVGQEAAVTGLLLKAGLAPRPARPDLAGVPRALVSRPAAGSP